MGGVLYRHLAFLVATLDCFYGGGAFVLWRVADFSNQAFRGFCLAG
jgi:hypothetical protein